MQDRKKKKEMQDSYLLRRSWEWDGSRCCYVSAMRRCSVVMDYINVNSPAVMLHYSSGVGDQSYFLPQRENRIYCSKILQAPHHPTSKSISTDTAGSPPSVAGQEHSTCTVPDCLFRELDPLTQTFSLLYLYHFLPVANKHSQRGLINGAPLS